MDSSSILISLLTAQTEFKEFQLAQTMDYPINLELADLNVSWIFVFMLLFHYTDNTENVYYPENKLVTLMQSGSHL